MIDPKKERKVGDKLIAIYDGEEGKQEVILCVIEGGSSIPLATKREGRLLPHWFTRDGISCIQEVELFELEDNAVEE